MSTFSYNDYKNARSASSAPSANNAQRIGFFKLKSDNDTALVRIKCSSTDDLTFASIHTLGQNMKWMKVACLNPVISTVDMCPFCRAAKAEDAVVTKASNRLYLQMMVCYKDPTTGVFSTPVPVIWDRPASFATEVVSKLQAFGDLTQVQLLITRHGVERDMKTTYSIDYAIPNIYSPEMIPIDFSAFNNFRIDKHSFWNKTADEMNVFLTTGMFPETVRSDAAPTQQPSVTQTYTPPPQTAFSAFANANAAQATQAMPFDQVPFEQPYTTAAQPTAQSQTTEQPDGTGRPVRNFTFKL